MLYAYFSLNRNLMGQVVTSIDLIKDYFIENKNNKKDYTYQRDKDIIEAIILLNNGTVDAEGYNISGNAIDVRLSRELRKSITFESDFGEIDLGLFDSGYWNVDGKENCCTVSNKIYKSEKFDSFNNFSKIMMTVNINMEDVTGNFTLLYVHEYCSLYEVYKKYVNKGEKIKFNELINMYLFIKCTIERNKSLNKKFPNGWKNKEFVEKDKLIKRYKNYTAFVNKYLEYMETEGLLKIIKMEINSKSGSKKVKNVIVFEEDEEE